MSVKNKLQKNTDNLLSRAQGAVADAREQGAALSDNASVRNLLSMENLTDGASAQLYGQLNSAENIVQSTFNLSQETFAASGPVIESAVELKERDRLLNVAKESGAIALMATAAPGAYARGALSLESAAPKDGSLVDLPMDGPAGSMGYTRTVSTEAYDESVLDKFLAQSVAFNTFAARQGPFGEAFYPTIVISADQGGADLAVRRQRVYNEVRHALTGKPTDFGFKNLLSAVVDPTILEDQSTRLVPYRDPTAPSDHLLSEDQFGEYSVTVAGTAVPTAPFKFDEQIDLLGISAYAPLMGAGIMDQTDAVAARATLTSVYLSGGAADAPVIRFNTQGFSRNAFLGAIEGRDRAMTLTFPDFDFVIDKDTKAVDGSAVTALAAIVSGDLTVHATALISGTLDTQFGTIQATAGKLKVSRITNASGGDVDLTTGAGLAAKTAVEALPLVGYDALCFRTNSNRRTAGLRLDVETIRERYTVLVGPPITVQRPATEDGEAAELEALINAVRARNENNAVTALLNQADTLRSTVKGPSKATPPAVAGMGRLLVKPYFEELELDMKQSMNSIKSRERAEDISSTLVQAVRDMAYRAYQYSEIQAALDAQNPTGSESPVLLLGTDQTIIRHLMVSGDTRTFGTQFNEVRVVVSQDERVRHHIFVSFTRNRNLDQLDPLRFGSFLWIPELVSRMPVSRNGATNLEAMVQPRTLHVSHLPILGIITVTNMPTALVDKTLQPAIATDVSNAYIDGIKFDTSKV